MNISIIINSIMKMIRDLYTGFSEWVNTSKDANVIAWVSTVFFSAFAIFIFKVPQRVFKLLHKRQALGNEKIIEEKYSTIDSDDSSSFILSTTIPVSLVLIGRDGDIGCIRHLLDQNDIVFIHASGGVGKTAIAMTIANDIKKEIIWSIIIPIGFFVLGLLAKFYFDDNAFPVNYDEIDSYEWANMFFGLYIVKISHHCGCHVINHLTTGCAPCGR